MTTLKSPVKVQDTGYSDIEYGINYIPGLDKYSILFLEPSGTDLENDTRRSTNISNNISISSDGNLYYGYNSIGGLYGSNLQLDSRFDKYSTITFTNNNEDTNRTLTFEFYANIQKLTKDKNDLLSIKGKYSKSSIYPDKRRVDAPFTITISLSGKSTFVDDETNEIIFDNATFYNENYSYSDIPIDKWIHFTLYINNNIVMLYMNQNLLVYLNSISGSDINNIKTSSISVYTGYSSIIQKQHQSYPYNSTSSDADIWLWVANSHKRIDHNIHYKSFRITNYFRYINQSPDGSNSNFNIQIYDRTNISRFVYNNNSTYKDPYNMIDLNFNSNTVCDNGILITEWTINTDEDGYRNQVDYHSGKFITKSNSKAIGINSHHTSIVGTNDNLVYPTEYTIEMDFIINSIENRSRLFTIFDKFIKTKEQFTVLLEKSTTTYNRYNIVIYANYISTSYNIKILDIEYNKINRLKIQSVGGQLSAYLNDVKSNNIISSGTKAFYFGDIIIGKYETINSFKGYLRNLTISCVARYVEVDNICKYPEIEEINSIKYYPYRVTDKETVLAVNNKATTNLLSKSFNDIMFELPESFKYLTAVTFYNDILRSVTTDNEIYIGIKDKNHLVYVNFENLDLRNIGSRQSVILEYSLNIAKYHTNIFSDDFYGKALSLEPYSEVIITGYDDLDLISLREFTIEIDFLPLSDSNNFYLLGDENSNFYLKYIDNHIYLYLPDTTGSKHEIKSYIHSEIGKAIHIAIQKNNNTIYLLINKVLTYTYNIPNLAKLDITHLYSNRNNISQAGYINKFAISNISRWTTSRWSAYSLDNYTLFYLPFDSESNIKNLIYPSAKDNSFNVSFLNQSYFKDLLSSGYGALGVRTSIIAKVSNESYTKYKSISTSFWYYLNSGNVSLYNLSAPVLKMSNYLFDVDDAPNRYYFLLEITNHATLKVTYKTFWPEGNKNNTDIEESFTIDASNAVDKSFYNYWNHIAVSYDGENKRFYIFVNGIMVLNQEPSCFRASSIASIGYETSYTHTYGSGNSYIASIRTLKSVYYTENFTPNIYGLLSSKSDYVDDSTVINDNIDQTASIAKIVYNKFPTNDTYGSTEINKQAIFIIPFPNYEFYTIEFWMYSTINTNSLEPVLATLYDRYDNLIYHLIFTQYNGHLTIHFSDHMTKPISTVILPVKVWSHFAITHDLKENQVKLWFNGSNIISTSYTGEIKLENIYKILFNSGNSRVYIDNFKTEQTLSYADNFVPANSYFPARAYQPNIRNLSNIISSVPEVDSIPALIYSKATGSSPPDTATRISAGPRNQTILRTTVNSDHDYYAIDFWINLYSNSSNESSQPLQIKLLNTTEYSTYTDSNVLETITLTKYPNAKNNYISWDGRVTGYESTEIVFAESQWVNIVLCLYKYDGTVRLWYNGINILNGTFTKYIPISDIRMVAIEETGMMAYINGMTEVFSKNYINNFIPAYSQPSGTVLQGSIVELNKNSGQSTTIISNKISNVDSNHITYLDFSDGTLKDKSPYNTDWLSYGNIMMNANVDEFNGSPTLYLDGTCGIYTNSINLDFNKLDNFTIELELMLDETNSITDKEPQSILVDYLSWLSMTADSMSIIRTEYNAIPNLELTAEVDLTTPTYIAYQRFKDIISIFIDGKLVKKYTNIPTGDLRNYITEYSTNNHVMDIGMTFIGSNNTNRFFKGYISKLAISNIARFNVDGKETSNTERYDNTIFYHPVLSPDFEAIYRTTDVSEPWYWRYLLRYTTVVQNINIIPLEYIGDEERIKQVWTGFAAFGPSFMDKDGYVEYATTKPYHKTFTFEFYAKLGDTVNNAYSLGNSSVDMFVIDNKFKIMIKSSMIEMYYYDSVVSNWKFICNYKPITEKKSISGNACEYWNHYAITYDNDYRVLRVFNNGKIVLTTSELESLSSQSIKLYTHKMMYYPIYYTTIRLSAGILYTESFNSSAINSPFKGYTELDKIDFNNLPIYGGMILGDIPSYIGSELGDPNLVKNEIDDSVISYLPFKTNTYGLNNHIAAGIECPFDITASNTDLFPERVNSINTDNPEVWNGYQALGPMILIDFRNACLLYELKPKKRNIPVYTIDFWMRRNSTANDNIDIVKISNDIGNIIVSTNNDSITLSYYNISSGSTRVLRTANSDLVYGNPFNLNNSWNHIAIGVNSIIDAISIHINGKRVILYSNEYSSDINLELKNLMIFINNKPNLLFYASIRISDIIRFTSDKFDISLVDHPYRYYVSIVSTTRNVIANSNSAYDRDSEIGEYRGDIDDHTIVYQLFKESIKNLAKGKRSNALLINNGGFNRIKPVVPGTGRRWTDFAGSLGPASRKNHGNIVYTYNEDTEAIYNYTIEFWMYKIENDFDVESNFLDIIALGDYNIKIFIQNNKFIIKKYFRSHSDPEETYIVDNSTSLVKWNHFALTYDEINSVLTIFFNGHKIYTVSNIITLNISSIVIHTNLMYNTPLRYTSIRISDIVRYKSDFSIRKVDYPFHEYAGRGLIARKVIFDPSKLYLDPIKVENGYFIDPHLALYISFSKTNPTFLWNSVAMYNTWFKFEIDSTNTDLYPNKIDIPGKESYWENYHAIGPMVVSSKEKSTLTITNIGSKFRSWTTEFWFYKGKYNEHDNHDLVEFVTAAGMKRVKVAIKEDRLEFYTDITISNYILESTITGLDNLIGYWNHLAFSYNGMNKTLYILLNGKVIYIANNIDELYPQNTIFYFKEYNKNYTLMTSLRIFDIDKYNGPFDIDLVNKPFPEYVNIVSTTRFVNGDSGTYRDEDEPGRRLWVLNGGIDMSTLLYFPIRNSNKEYDRETPVDYMTSVYNYDNPFLVESDYSKNYTSGVNNPDVWLYYNPIGPNHYRNPGNIHIINTTDRKTNQFTIEFWIYRKKSIN